MQKVFITQSGEGEKSILFLHGLWGGGNYFREIDFLKNIGTNYFPDELGFGKSERPDIDYTREVHCESIYDAISKDKQYTIVANSFGTVLAISFAKLYPHLVKNLVLLSPLIYKTVADAKSHLRKTFITRLTIDTPSIAKGMCLSVCKTNILSKAAPFFSKPYEKTFISGCTAHTWHSYYSTFQECLLKEPLFPIAETIFEKIPTLIIYGEKDKYINPQTLTKLSSKNLTMKKIAHANHDVLFEKMEYCEKTITEFLKGYR